jgi:hypothetical protein
VLAGGCAGGDEDDSTTDTLTVTVTTTATVTETTTDTTESPGPAGTLPVNAFNARAESVDEAWERDLEATTAEFLALEEQEGGSRSFQSTSSGDRASASLLVDGLGDDSVRARRYELTFSRRDDGTWMIESATWVQRCHEGRGHQDFSPEPCV